MLYEWLALEVPTPPLTNVFSLGVLYEWLAFEFLGSCPRFKQIGIHSIRLGHRDRDSDSDRDRDRDKRN